MELSSIRHHQLLLAHFKKSQFAAWIDAMGGGTEASFINRLFGIYA